MPVQNVFKTMFSSHDSYNYQKTIWHELRAATNQVGNLRAVGKLREICKLISKKMQLPKRVPSQLVTTCLFGNDTASTKTRILMKAS